MGMLVYNTSEEVLCMGLKRVADGLKKGELEFDLYYDPDIKDETIKLMSDGFYIYLCKYGAYAKCKSLIFNDNGVHITFEPLSVISEAVRNIINCIEANTYNITLVSKPGVGKELKSKLLSLLKD